MGRRRSAKKDIETDSDESSFKAPVTKPKRKKRKVATGKDDGAQQHDSKALLQLMVNMPVDILLEVRPALPYCVVTGQLSFPDIQTPWINRLDAPVTNLKSSALNTHEPHQYCCLETNCRKRRFATMHK